MHQLPPMTEKEMREELLSLAEDFQGDILLLECLSQADLSDCCEPSALEALRQRLYDYTSQHVNDMGRLAEWLVNPPRTPFPASSR